MVVVCVIIAVKWTFITNEESVMYENEDRNFGINILF